MARKVSRNAKTGRFTKASTARRSPETTTTERVGSGTSNNTTVYRSAKTGEFVTERTALCYPNTTISQQV